VIPLKFRAASGPSANVQISLQFTETGDSPFWPFDGPNDATSYHVYNHFESHHYIQFDDAETWSLDSSGNYAL
jgi:hypothetical protein